jgi:Asp-tRNA(Asn)/Glu-tRNA(Gln) amidotransferase A subunit family amidase
VQCRRIERRLGGGGGCLVAMACGSEGSGCPRFPPSAFGLPTLKPTKGRAPHSLPAAGNVDPTGGLWPDFVLVRTARD